jgi:hypothetical protein
MRGYARLARRYTALLAVAAGVIPAIQIGALAVILASWAHMEPLGPGPGLWIALGAGLQLLQILWGTAMVITYRSGLIPITFLINLASIVVTFAAAYWQMSPTPGSCMNAALTRVDSIYFTLTTLTTVGFGDIVPVTEACRAIVSTQLAGTVFLLGFLAVLLSRTSRD